MPIDPDRMMKDAQAAGNNGEFKRAISILDLLLDDSALSQEARAEALLFRAEAKRISREPDGAIADYSAVLGLPGAGEAQLAEALHGRARSRAYKGLYREALADLTDVVAMPGISADRRASALLSRGEVRLSLGDAKGELSDYEAVLAMKEASPNRRAAALLGRGYARHTPDPRAAEADYRSVLAMDGVADKWRRLAQEHLDKLRRS